MSATSHTLPSEVRQALVQVVADLRAASADNLVGVALYGGLAKGRYTPGISDVNLLVVVREAGFGALRAVAPVLTAARRRSRVVAWVVTPADLQAAARLFPTKIQDIQAAHSVLFGDVVLASVPLDRGAMRLRAQQDLWNIGFRLRQRAVERAADPPILWGGILASLPKVSVTLESILRIRGVAVPSDRAGVLRAAATPLGVAAERMEVFAAIRRHAPRPDDETVATRFGEYLRLLGELAAAIEALR